MSLSNKTSDDRHSALSEEWCRKVRWHAAQTLPLCSFLFGILTGLTVSFIVTLMSVLNGDFSTVEGSSPVWFPLGGAIWAICFIVCRMLTALFTSKVETVEEWRRGCEDFMEQYQEVF